MNIDPQIMRMLELFGPYLLGAVGLLLTSVAGGIGAVGRALWRSHQKRMELMAEALTKLAQGISAAEGKIEIEHKKIWDAVMALRAELQMANRNTDAMKAGILKLEGAMENQRATIQDYVKATEKMGGKMEAIFRFVDAPRRATDSGG